MSTTTPGTLMTMTRVAVGALPFFSRSTSLPGRIATLDASPINRAQVADYAAVTGLQYGNNVALTYPFVLTFPAVMSLISEFDFPFSALGAVHLENHITQYRPIAVTDTVSATVHTENLREHRKGVAVDVISDVYVGNEKAWHQVTTFLHRQRTSLTSHSASTPQRQPKLPPPTAVLRVTPGKIRRYATISGDHNPIHTSTIGAVLFGFPAAIAHGMFSAAAALTTIEAQLPDAVRYRVKFGKPMVLPAQAGLFCDHVNAGWDISLRHRTQGYPYLTATVRNV